MSLQGEIAVMRSGRSSSQVSIYNYPEHLNPFYEDEQHKRLRFWHINKKKNGSENRRSSFSINDLRDIWAFKSFRLKKKSSTLGINKTSESPPLLRRDGQYSVHNGDSDYDGNFQRNNFYRCSLQNMNTNGHKKDSFGEINFNRSNEDRNSLRMTLGPVNRVESSRTVPVPRRNVNAGTSLRSSQASLESCNPFESDNEVSENISMTHSTPVKKIQRKKRRAPPVPVTIDCGKDNCSNISESSQENALNIEESFSDIKNLTAEIENFVNTSNTDNLQISPESNENDTTQPTKADPVAGVVCIDVSGSPTKENRRETSPPLSTENGDSSRITPIRELGCVECIHVHVDSPRVKSEVDQSSRVTSFRSNLDNKKSTENILAKTSFVLTGNPNVRKESSPSLKDTQTIEESSKKEDELKIVYKIDEIPTVQEKLIAKISVVPKKETDSGSSKRETRENSIDKSGQLSSSELQPQSLKIIESQEDIHSLIHSAKIPTMDLYRQKEETQRFEWKKTTLAPLETHIPPEKRKSVKDIIESINRSQRLLNAGAYRRSEINVENFPVSIPQQNENINPNGSSDVEKTSDCLPRDIGEDSTKINNSEFFKKFRINKEVHDYRETSPTAFNLDWNPLPKPKRTKNISD